MNTKQKPGLFLMELNVAKNGHDCVLWVSDVNKPDNTKAFDFVGVEADTVTEVLDQVYVWIDGLGYGLLASEIIVFDLQEFGVLLGKQAKDSLWSRDYGDFVSHFAGAMGMTCGDASDALIRPLMGLEGESRYYKMGEILTVLRRQTRTVRDLLSKTPLLVDYMEELRRLMGVSSLAERLFSEFPPGKEE